MAEDKNELITLIDNVMEKNQENNKKIQAETHLTVKAVEENVNERLEKNGLIIEGLTDKLEKMEVTIKKNAIKKAETLKDTLALNFNSADFKDFAKTKAAGEKGSYQFDVPMQYNAMTIGAGVNLEFREMGVGKSPVRPPTVSDIIQWGTTTSPQVSWVIRSAKTDAAAMRTQGETMLEGDLTYAKESVDVKIASEFMKVDNEQLKDTDFLASEINSELLSDLKLLVDTQILEGPGTTNTMLGIVPQATDWAAGDFAGGYVAPNEADVLRVGINQIFVTGQGRWYPSYILMHPDDVTKLDLLRDSNGDYLEVPFYSYNGMVMKSVPVMQNVGITAGDFLIGDFSRAKAFMRDSLTVRVYDQNENDPLFNRSTVTANIRWAFRIKTPDLGAFVTGDFATAITALTTV